MTHRYIQALHSPSTTLSLVISHTQLRSSAFSASERTDAFALTMGTPGFDAWGPPITAMPRAREPTAIWARDVEPQIDRRIFVDHSTGEPTTIRVTTEICVRDVTVKRPDAAWRITETARLQPFMRDEPKLCAHALAYLRAEHFVNYRDRRRAIVFAQKLNGRAVISASVHGWAAAHRRSMLSCSSCECGV
jgi:hypothetical protein